MRNARVILRVHKLPNNFAACDVQQASIYQFPLQHKPPVENSCVRRLNFQIEGSAKRMTESNRAGHPGGHYWDYCPGVPSLSKVVAIQFKIGHP